MKKHAFLAAAVACAGCSTTELDIDSRRPEAEEINNIQHQLSERLEQRFGKGARVQQVFGRDERLLIGVAVADRVEDSDIRSPVALAKYDVASDALEVVAERAEYKEAKVLSSGLAVVSAEGELRIRSADGAEQVLAKDVKGEVSETPGGALLATFEGGTRPRGDSAVLLTAPTGDITLIADGEGVDDRPSLSPDQKTVVFVSGRTGVASLWRTDLDGSEPVQLTNTNLVVGEERSGPPEGFVPPPVMADRIEWVSEDVVRYDAGDAEMWSVNVRTGEATREGGVR